MKKFLIFIGIVLTACVVSLVLTSVTLNTGIPPEEHIFVSNNMSEIKYHIEAFNKKGYQTKLLYSQSVSTSIVPTHNQQYRDIKGDIILIMTKH